MTFRAMLLLLVFSMLDASPSFGCLHTPSLATVDKAMSQYNLSSSDQAKAAELRARLEDALGQGNYRDAAPLERQIMDLMGLTLLPSRGCGHWIPKTD
jgi:hypothetical protein